MRTLHLLVTGNKLEKHPAYLFMGRRSEVGQPIKISVSFSPEWDRVVKVMAFYDHEHKECTPQEICNGVCEVPPECLKNHTFYMRVLGLKDGKMIDTDMLSFMQIGG